MEAITWTTIEVFGRRSTAHVAGSALDNAGIQWRIVADDLGGMGGLPIFGTRSGAELQVPVEDVELAREVLDLPEGAGEAGDPWSFMDAWPRLLMTFAASASVVALVWLLALRA